MERDLRPVIILLTVCTLARNRILARPEVHAPLRPAWREAAAWIGAMSACRPSAPILFAARGRAIVGVGALLEDRSPRR